LQKMSNIIMQLVKIPKIQCKIIPSFLLFHPSFELFL
jgi:hypothetical protein